MAGPNTINPGWQSWSIYVLLSDRCDHSTFHLGLVVTKSLPDAHYWHANNPQPDCVFKAFDKNTSSVLFSKSLVMAYKLGTITPAGWDLCYEVLMDQANALNALLPRGPPPIYRCRTFALEAIHAMHNRGVLQLTMSVAEIQQDFDRSGLAFLPGFEANGANAQAQILNETGASTTA